MNTAIASPVQNRRRNWLLKRANTLVAQAGFADSRIKARQAIIEAEIAEVIARHTPFIDAYTKRRDSAMNKLQAIVVDDEQWELLMQGERGKSLTLRSGTISRRTSSAVQIDDADAALSWLRRNKKLLKYTTQAAPVLSKAKLAKAREIVRKLPGVRIVDSENMLVKPVVSMIELKRELKPLRRPLQ